MRTPVDKQFNTFPREYNGQFAENDVYIDCQNGIQITHYGRGVLEAYIPSLQSGRSILKTIYRDFINENNTETKINTYDVERKGEVISVTKETISILDENLYKQDITNSDFIISFTESDSEVIFKFHSKHMEQLEPILKPKTNGANISPFSSKNLPKTKYIIPDEDFTVYKNIVSKLPQNQLITLVHITKDFLQSLVTKKNTWDNIKSDMALKGLKGKEYIHSIGKWDEYIKYLEKNI